MKMVEVENVDQIPGLIPIQSNSRTSSTVISQEVIIPARIMSILSIPQKVQTKKEMVEVQNVNKTGEITIQSNSRKSTGISQHVPSPSSANKKINKNWEKIENYLIKLTLSTAFKNFKFAALIKCVPFEPIDNQSLRVQMFPQQWRRILWQIVSFLTIDVSIFKCLYFLVVFERLEFGTEMAIHIFNTILSSLFFVMNMSLYLKPEECAFMLNQHDFIFRASPDLGMGNAHWASHPIVMTAVVYLSRMHILLGISFTTMFVLVPQYSAHMYSVFPESWKVDGGSGNAGLFIVCTALEICWITWGLATIDVFFCYWVAIIFTVNTALETLGQRIELTAKDIHAYLYLQIFMVLFNDFNGRFFAPGFYTAITTAPILYLFLAITSYDSVNIFVYLSFPVSALFCIFLIIYFLPQHAKIAIFSANLLSGLENRPIGSMNSSYKGMSRVPMLSTLAEVELRSPQEREEYLRKRAGAFCSTGVRNSIYGYCSLGTSLTMQDQLCNNLLLLLSLI